MFHPQCRVKYKSEARLKLSSQEADSWVEEISEFYNLLLSVSNTAVKGIMDSACLSISM